eukprot:gene2490-2996_t
MSSNPITVIPPQVEHHEDTSMVVVRILTGEEELLNTDLFINCGVNESKEDDLGEAPRSKLDVFFELAKDCSKIEKFIGKLDAFPDIINEQDKDGYNALLIAASFNNDDAVELLLERGATLNAISREGFTALMYAATNSNKRILEMLVAKGADQAVRDKRGWTAYHIATLYRTAVELVPPLMKVDFDEERIIVVLSAAATNNVDAMAKLLDAGFDINSQDP